LSSWEPVSFSRRTVLHGVSCLSWRQQECCRIKLGCFIIHWVSSYRSFETSALSGKDVNQLLGYTVSYLRRTEIPATALRKPTGSHGQLWFVFIQLFGSTKVAPRILATHSNLSLAAPTRRHDTPVLLRTPLNTNLACLSWLKLKVVFDNIDGQFELQSELRYYIFNPLQTKRRPLYLKPQSVRAVNTFHLDYKNQSVFYVSGTSRCLFSDIHKTHKYSVGRAYNFWMLNYLVHHVTSRV
jgi:hypothetical protein